MKYISNCLHIILVSLCLLWSCQTYIPGKYGLHIIQIRGMNAMETRWWKDTLSCLVEKDKITSSYVNNLYLPIIHIVEEDFFDVKGQKTSSYSSKCKLYFAKSLDNIPMNGFVWKHEYTHCIESQIKGSTGHDSDWWFTNAAGLRASVCQ